MQERKAIRELLNSISARDTSGYTPPSEELMDTEMKNSAIHDNGNTRWEELAKEAIQKLEEVVFDNPQLNLAMKQRFQGFAETLATDADSLPWIELGGDPYLGETPNAILPPYL